MTNIQNNITTIKDQIHQYEQCYARKPNSVTLLAVSKTQPIAAIEQAIAAGQLDFGENYLQEALPKMAALDNKNLIWHFIGDIQSNKTKKIAAHFSWVHSVCDQKIAQRLSDQRPISFPPLNICIQVNVSREPTKAGIDSKDVLPLAIFCSSLPNLRLRGLMAIPSPQKNLEDQRAEFHKLRLLYESILEKGIKVDTLSMGMSSDMEAAIAEGASIVRIGTAIFGART